MVQGQTGGASGSASEERRDESEENNTKRQRICVVKNGNQREYKEDISKRKQDKILNRITEQSIIEVYSPPRVSEVAKKYGITSHGSFDITVNDPDDQMPWDLNLKSKRDKVLKIIRECKPSVVIGSPMCTAFSTLQNMNRHKKNEDEWKSRMRDAIRHMEFACQIYELQISEGRYFVHEHPMNATSWGLKCIKRVRAMNRVMVERCDQCMTGLKTTGKDGMEAYAMKPTRFMTNSECVAEEVSNRCDGSHTHQPLTQGRAADAAIYPKNYVKELRKGLRIN